MIKELVSIITPSYNSSKFIEETIASVQAQTYSHWEMLITDDGSTDNSFEIIKEICKKDSRVKLFSIKNAGPAVARNNSIKHAKGKYLAFLDSDDLWMPNKLALQIKFMKKNNYNFTFTSYMMIDDKSSIIKNSLIQSLQKISYDDMLSENIIGCLTVIYNQEKLGKIYMPNIRKRQDYGLWFKILKNEKFAYGMKESLAYYRIGQSSLSKNKFDLIKWNWILFHKVEKHSLFKSSYYLLLNIFNKVKKDIILNQKTK